MPDERSPMTATPDTVSAREQAALQEPLQLNSRGMRIRFTQRCQ